MGPVINSTYSEQDPWISFDGNLLGFASDRPGGYGIYDLWMSRKVGGNWQTPVNFGDVINTSNWESNCWLSPDTLRLFFGAYQRSGGYGGWDMWMSTKAGGVWQLPVNMGPNINTSAADGAPSLTADELTLYFTADNGSNLSDVYFSKNVSGVWQPRQNLGTSVNSAFTEDRAWVSSDGQKLYFCSNRPGGRGNEDLYYSEQGISGIENEIPPGKPTKLNIGNPKPNPSNRSLSVGLELPSPTKVQAEIFNLAGQMVRTLMDNFFPAGHLDLVWDEKDSRGSKVAPGIYFMRITAGGENATRQITILR